MLGNNIGIYIHVPFCFGKCPYCDFYSVYPQKIEEYVSAVCSEIDRWGKRCNKTVDTIYFGGGTPSILKYEQICKIIESIKNNFVVQNPEITMEVNPADYNKTDFRNLAAIGVNRISIGAQSLCENELKILGRRHTVDDIFNTCESIKQAGIKNISMDLILGAPEQKRSSIDKFINFCKVNDIKHISAYLLKIEEETPYYKNQCALNLHTEDEYADVYKYFCRKSENSGYAQYEISNFSLKGYESKHNLKYWNLSEYLGIGPSAHSLLNGSRFYYENSLSKFITDAQILNEGVFEAETEYAMLRLRLTDGLENNLYKKKFEKDIPEKYFLKAKKYQNLDLIICDNQCIRLTQEGFLLSNLIIGDIIS